MTNRNRLLYALVLLPTLLLTSCYKDFNKVRVKPFKPDLVVPLATADSITFEDMLVRDEDTTELDKGYPDKRIGLKYELGTYAASNTISFKDGGELTFSSDPKSIIESLFPGESDNIERVKEITFEKDAVLKSATAMRLPLKKGGEFVLEANTDFIVPEVSSVEIGSVSEDGTVDVNKGGIQSVRVVRKNFSSIKGTNNLNPAEIRVYKGLLWYSGELTDPRVILRMVRTKWLRNVKINYWFDECYLEVNDGSGTKQALIGENEGPLPFNMAGGSTNKGTLDADKDTVEKEYSVKASNLGKLSKDWPIRINLGKLFGEVETPQEFTLERDGSLGKIISKVKIKLPFTGRFNALVREFKPGNDSTVSLPDVNKLLQDSGGKVNIKSSFADNDMVLLHFYFKNATPMDIYLAAKIGGNNKLPKGEAGQRASVIEGLNSGGIDGAELKKDNKLKIGDFRFFKAMGGADVDEKNKELGLADTTKMKSKEVTIEIPYGEYEKARKSAAGRQLTALLLFRSPNGKDGKPIVVSPRLEDFVSIRLGVEVKPEVSIELMNKE